MIISDDNKSKTIKQKNPELNTSINTNSDFQEDSYEKNIRPMDFDNYIGQSSLKETLKIILEAGVTFMHLTKIECLSFL